MSCFWSLVFLFTMIYKATPHAVSGCIWVYWINIFTIFFYVNNYFWQKVAITYIHSMHLYVMSQFLTKSFFFIEKVVIICCQLFEINVFHGVRGEGEVTWKFGNFRLIWKGWIEKICCFRGTQNLSGELWP